MHTNPLVESWFWFFSFVIVGADIIIVSVLLFGVNRALLGLGRTKADRVDRFDPRDRSFWLARSRAVPRLARDLPLRAEPASALYRPRHWHTHPRRGALYPGIKTGP